VSTHSKTAQHSAIDQQGNASLTDQADGSGQDSGLSSADVLGQDNAGSPFMPTVDAAPTLWSEAAAMTAPAYGLASPASVPALFSASPAVTISTPGSGLVFDNTYGSSCTAQYEACIVAAEKQLESLFTNSDTINVTFNESNEGNNGDALGNSSNGYDYSYATLKTALLKVAPGDVLPATDPSGGSTKWYVPEAYGRMLGLTSTTGSPDLSVTLNSYYSWDFGQDVINGLTHELSEGGLGRIGDLGGSGGGSWGTMDLFRYNAAGQADYSNGRDGDTTYFSSNGGATLSNQDLPAKGAPTLSYNNQYNSNGTLANTGDTADWVQNNVFGSTGDGETLALTQTELQVMEALGWHLTLKQDVDSNSGSWETPTNWSTGSMPIEPQDVYIDNAIVALNADVLVNSVATSAGALLAIGNSAACTLTAVDGTNLNTEDASSAASGNLGEIEVCTGSALQVGYFSETFSNAGTVLLGKGAGGSGFGALNIAGTVDLSGGGTVTLGQTGTTGDILNAPGLPGSGLVNVDNTISGSGLIDLGSFDNQADGHVDAQSHLQISVGTFTNEGLITDEANATLDLGADGATQSLANTGSVIVDAGADVAISGNYTVSGSGAMAFKGAGAAITSDGSPATFTNASVFDAEFSGRIGDANLTFDNTGTATVLGSGVTLTIDTGTNTVLNTGTLVAESNATLAIASNLVNQGTVDVGTYSSTNGTTTGTLALGVDGGTASASNTGEIVVYNSSDLAISGNYALGGSGNLYLKGAGAITSDGTAPATFANASNITATGSNQIGDVGIKSSNDLTFSNSGTVGATDWGATLTIDTGANIVVNTGLMEAANSATLAIVSDLNNQGSLSVGTSTSGGTSTGTLDLGADGATGSAINTGVIDVWGGSDLAISGNYTVGGSGSIDLKGAGAAITSDGNAPATFTNASTIEAFGSSQIGDVGFKTANDLTFVNTGAVVAWGSGTTLTLNTGANTINDAGGLLEAETSATLVIDSSVNTGTNGSIAASGGTVLMNAALSGGGTLSAASGSVLDIAGGASFAGAITGAGTVDLAGVTTLNAGASLSAADVIESSSLTLAGVKITNASADTYAMTASSGTTISLARTGAGSFTNNGTLLVNGAGTARITAPLVDAGTIEVTAGNLQIAGALSGTGGLAIGAGTTADITAAGALTEAVSGAGKLILGGAHTLAGAGVTVATVQVGVGSALSGSGSLTGAALDSGTLAASGGTLAVGGKVSGNGTLSAGAGAVLDLAGGGSFAGAITGAGTIALAGATTLDAGAKLLASDIVETANLTLAGVAVTNAVGDSFAITASTATTVTLGSSGTGSFTNAGSLVANGAGTAQIKAPFTNSGTVSALSGTMSFLGSIGGTGTLDVGAAGTLSLGLGAASGQTVDFLASTGALDLSHPLDFAGTINGFGGSDSIFLANTSFTGFSFANDLLTVKHGTTTVASLNITESSNMFSLTSESSGVLITFH
jgi:hypothetical protein